MSARKAGRALQPVPVIDLWRRRVPLAMGLVGAKLFKATGRDREDARLADAILDSDESSREAIAVKLRLAFEFAGDDMISDIEWSALGSIARSLLPRLPRDLAAALKPFIADSYSTRRANEAWSAGAAAAFPEAAQAIAKVRGRAA